MDGAKYDSKRWKSITWTNESQYGLQDLDGGVRIWCNQFEI